MNHCIMPHETLRNAGWQCQTTIDEPRLSEIAEAYRALGYEVRVVQEGVTVGCGACDPAGAGRVGTLYIRRDLSLSLAPTASIEDEDLFAL